MRSRTCTIPHSRPGARRPRAGRRALLVAGMAASMLWAGTAAASAGAASEGNPIEGVWSFNGGKVAIQAQPGGTFLGTVVSPTKFAECVHPAGEKIWTGITPQPDGSYWGYHQWYFAGSNCTLNPTLGLAAWRVVKAPDGGRSLRVCLSEPGSTSQPTIAVNGNASGDTYGCVPDSAPLAPLPTVTPAQFSQYVTLPSSKSCIAGKTLRIRMRDPKNDPIKKAVVSLKSGKVHRVAKLKRHGETITATLNLKGLSAASFTVRVRVTTVLGDHLSGKRSYHLCATARHRHHKHHRG